MQGVNTHHSDFDKFADKWRKCRDFAAGQDAVRKAGKLYLAMNGAEEPDAYKARVGRSDLYNATWITIKTLRGMMFSKEPTRELPGAIEKYADDIDMAGTPLATFARSIAAEVLNPGRVGIMVDHPSVEGIAPMSVAAAEEQGLRPMLKCYKTECIINWKYRRVRNRYVLSMVVLKEKAEEADGEFKSKMVDQWRVLDLDESDRYRVRLFQKSDKGGEEFVQVGDDLYPLMQNKPMGFIPFYLVGPDGLDSDLDEPPLIDLVDANEAHYQINSDLRTTLHFGVPTLCISGYVPDDGANIVIGSRAAMTFPDPNAKAYFAEPEGPMVPEMRSTLQDLENRMAMLGARMLMEEKRGVEAAETAKIKRQGENASLADIAMAVSEALEKALTVFAQWAGVNGEVVYQLNRDYNAAGLGPAELTALLKAVMQGELSSQSLFELLQRHDVVDPELTYEEERERIDQSAPARPIMPPANDGGNEEDAA